jgi:hypothetical protein
MSGLHLHIDSPRIVWSRHEQARAWSMRLAFCLIVIGIATPPLFGLALKAAYSWGGPEFFRPQYHRLFASVVLIAKVVPLVAMMAAILRAWGVRWRGQPTSGAVVVNGAAVSIALRRFAVRDVAQGSLDGTGNVSLRFRGGLEAAVQVSDRAEGERLLEALGVSTERRVLRVPLRSSASLRRGGQVAAIAALVPLVVVGGFFVSVHRPDYLI